VDGGILTVGGLLTVGINNTGRWSVLDINGGELVCTAPGASVVLGAPSFAGSSLFVVRSGTARVERIQFGQSTYAGNGVVKLTGGDLYVGSGGLDIGTASGDYLPILKLNGGTLGATASWSSDAGIGIQIANTAVIQAGDASDAPHDITLNGPISGPVGSLVKSGLGTLTLNGTNSYLGSTEVTAGTLSLATKSLSDEAAVILSASATLNLGFSGFDRVAELVVDGQTMPNGVYGRVGSAGGIIASSFITGDGLLAVGVDGPAASGYASWAAANGLTEGVNDGFEQDPDLDGIANSLEFALGGNPLVSSTSVLPQLTVDASNFVFSFNRRDESEAEVALNFSWGSALVTWANEVLIGETSAAADASGVVVTVTEGVEASDPDSITVTVPRANAVAGKLFGRLGAAQKP
jgi:autotransporter-associated beta strand protein